MRATTLLTSLSTCFLFTAPQRSAAQLVINEVDYDQPGIDSHEFVELKNTGSSTVSLQNVALLMISGAGGGAAVYRSVADPLWPALTPGAYFVICANGGITSPCDYDVIPDVDLVQNGPTDALALIDITDSTVIDMLSYEGDVPGYFETAGFPGDDPFYGGAGGTMENVGLSRFPDGGDTDNNSTDFILACATPGTVNEVDTIGCPISTGVAPVAAASFTFNAFVDHATNTIWLMGGTVEKAPVIFSVFTTDGRLIAERTANGPKASWACHTEARGVFVVRASTSKGARSLRVVLP